MNGALFPTIDSWSKHLLTCEYETNRITKHIDTLFLIAHQSTFGVSLQALILIQYICSSNRSQCSLMDRFYLTLYASLHDLRLTHASKQFPRYLNLLFRSIRADPSCERQQAFILRLVQVLVSGAPGGDAAAVEWVVGGLALLGEVRECT
jgi:ribosome biogenesis protein MAK21